MIRKWMYYIILTLLFLPSDLSQRRGVVWRKIASVPETKKLNEHVDKKVKSKVILKDLIQHNQSINKEDFKVKEKIKVKDN